MDYMNQRVSCMKSLDQKGGRKIVCNACRYVYQMNMFTYMKEYEYIL